MPKPDGPQFSAYEQELMNAAERSMKEAVRDGRPLGRGKGGLLGPLDADQADRSKAAGKDMSDFGYEIEPTDSVGRGFSVNTGIPDVSVAVGANPEGRGFSVGVHHGDRFKTNEDGSYVHPEDWGDHREMLDVDRESLPQALMDHLSRPDVRRHMYPPTMGSDNA